MQMQSKECVFSVSLVKQNDHESLMGERCFTLLK